MKLVLLPGMDGTGKLFADFVNALPTPYDTAVVAYSTLNTQTYEQLEDVVRQTCPLAEPFILVAESYSAPIAIKYSASHPKNLKGLVLCAGFASSPLQGWRRLAARFLVPILFLMKPPAFAVRHWLVGPSASASLVRAVQGAISSVRPSVLAARLRSILSCDLRDDLRNIKVPVLYMKAQQDRLVRSSCSEEIARLIPTIRIVTLEGPHLILQRHPESAAKIVTEFEQTL